MVKKLINVEILDQYARSCQKVRRVSTWLRESGELIILSYLTVNHVIKIDHVGPLNPCAYFIPSCDTKIELNQAEGLGRKLHGVAEDGKCNPVIFKRKPKYPVHDTPIQF